MAYVNRSLGKSCFSRCLVIWVCEGFEQLENIFFRDCFIVGISNFFVCSYSRKSRNWSTFVVYIFGAVTINNEKFVQILDLSS